MEQKDKLKRQKHFKFKSETFLYLHQEAFQMNHSISNCSKDTRYRTSLSFYQDSPITRMNKNIKMEQCQILLPIYDMMTIRFESPCHAWIGRRIWYVLNTRKTTEKQFS